MEIEERIKFQFKLWDEFQEMTSAPAPARQAFMDALDKMWRWTKEHAEKDKQP